MRKFVILTIYANKYHTHEEEKHKNGLNKKISNVDQHVFKKNSNSIKYC